MPYNILTWHSWEQAACVREQDGPGQLDAEGKDVEQPWVGRLLDLYIRLLEKGEGMAPSPGFGPARQLHPSHAVPLAAYELALQGGFPAHF